MPEDQPDAPDAERPLLPNPAIPPAVQAHLRRSLEVLRDDAQDPTVRRRIDDVLQGRGSLRDLARDGGFSAFMEPLVRRGMARMDELSPEERAAAEDGAAAFRRGETPTGGDSGPASPGPAAPPAPPSAGTW